MSTLEEYLNNVEEALSETNVNDFLFDPFDVKLSIDDLTPLTDNQLDLLYTYIFGYEAYHMSREGYIHCLIGKVMKAQL